MDINKEAEQLFEYINGEIVNNGNARFYDKPALVEKILQSFERICREQREACAGNLSHFQVIECKQNEKYIHESDASFDINTTPLLTDNK